MRITMLVTTDVVNDPRVMKEATALAQAGHAVRVIGVRRGRRVAARESRDGVEVRRLALWHLGLLRSLSSRIGRAVSPTTTAGVAARRGLRQRLRQVLSSAFVQARDALHLLTVSLAFSVEALRQPSDAYHAHNHDTLPAAMLAAWLKRVPLVYDAHEYMAVNLVGRPFTLALYRIIESAGARKSARVFTVNRTIARWLARDYSIPRPTVLLNGPADLDFPHPAPSGDGRTIEVLYHGVYHAARGIDQLVAAMALVRSPVRLILRGFGEVESALKAQAARLGLGSKVVFAPPVPMADLCRAASASHIGVIPYTRRLAAHALPNKIFEYMAAGLAVLTNDLPELATIVREHGCGMVYGVEDPAAIAQAIDELARDRRRLDELRVRAWQAYHERYAWRRQKRQLLDAYAELGKASHG